ncbi:hypothetical protein BGZ73_007045 [Actinomortierella ambigua]|nr:hypothetical protein BGZ73_007045 [Actinomortierella ambigua]
MEDSLLFRSSAAVSSSDHHSHPSSSKARASYAQPRKSLADLLFEAQSHYISHRYPQALALYLEAVCDHESVQACNSLYALYTAAKQERGLVRSDTRATRALIHALQIWARKRWPQANVSSDPVISSLMNLDPLLKTIYATSDQQSSVHPHQLQGSQPTSPTSASSAEGKPKRRDLIESFFADGSSRFWRKGRIEVRDHGSGESLHHHPRQGALTDDNLALGGESEDDEESGSETSGSDDIGDGGDESDVESLVDGRSDSDLDSGDEELDPEQRGQATGEIEDIVQRLCQMIQKGVLGLDEPIVMDAIAMLQWIAQALANEADEHHKQEHQEKLLQQSSLGAVAPTASPGGSNNNTNQNDVAPQAPSGLLLLIQPLQLSEVDDEMANPAKQGSSPAPSRPLRHSTSSSVRSLAHHRGAHLTAGQRALDLTFCRAMRIRIMSTLGWVHHQRHEYKYGAQAYAVCSEIAPKTGRIQVDTLQRKAVELMRHCQEMDLQQQKDAGGASTVCSSGASINSVHSSSATLHQVFDISTPSTVSTTETGSVCPLSAEVDQNAPVLQQQQQQPILASEAQVLEAAIRIAGLAMESKLKPTVYEGGPVLAAEREARRVCVCEEEPSSPSPPPSAASTSTATATMKVYSKDDNRSPSSPCPRPVETRESLRGRSRSRTRMSADGATKGGAHHLLRIQTEPSLLAKGSSLPKAIATGPQSSSSSSLPFSRRPSLGNHAHSMPQQQPNQHQRHRHCPHSHHHPKAQQQASRPKASGLVFGQPPKNPTQVTLSTCGHCGKKGMQMPLCVCKATRYCNRDCRLADMEVHRSTGCHAALIGGI